MKSLILFLIVLPVGFAQVYYLIPNPNPYNISYKTNLHTENNSYIRDFVVIRQRFSVVKSTEKTKNELEITGFAIKKIFIKSPQKELIFTLILVVILIFIRLLFNPQQFFPNKGFSLRIVKKLFK
jgi:hypothetical protein